VDDHQTANAQYLVVANGALLMPQGQFNQQSIVALLSPYLAKPSLIKEMAANAKQQAILDATASVAMHCEQVTNKRA
jgi:UDP-N-acetylglucosamine--N-acetylmuramyl-(pentapeptide) pyrophosphoryl-undecaprenol N-acetylglucosamine transferase